MTDTTDGWSSEEMALLKLGAREPFARIDIHTVRAVEQEFFGDVGIGVIMTASSFEAIPEVDHEACVHVELLHLDPATYEIVATEHKWFTYDEIEA